MREPSLPRSADADSRSDAFSAIVRDFADIAPDAAVAAGIAFSRKSPASRSTERCIDIKGAFMGSRSSTLTRTGSK